MLRLANIRAPLGFSDDELRARIAALLRLPEDDVRGLRILRKSLDARDKRRLEYVYTAAVEMDDEEALLRRDVRVEVARFAPPRFDWPDPGSQRLERPPVIVGAGPAGLFAALMLAEHGYRPILLERGREVSERIPDVKAFDAGGSLDPESNYLFGEGGAGTFSDGKLTCRSAGPDADKVLEIFARSKGKPSVVYEAKPHLGSNRLPAVVKSLRRQIQAAGGEIRFNARVVDLELADNLVRGVRLESGMLPTSIAVLAIGHSARDTYRMLHTRGVPMSAKPFQLGVRIEQPQINVTCVQYGSPSLADILGPADYTMKVRAGDNDFFTFCMCAGGYVMPSVSAPGYFCTNGMSRSKHESPYANSGLVTTVDPAALETRFGGDALAGVRYQEALESAAFGRSGDAYRTPIQWARDFLSQRLSSAPPTSYPRGGVTTNLWEILPVELCDTVARGLVRMDRQWRGRFLEDATLVAPEARGSSPVRIERDRDSMQSPAFAGLYPIGEGAGFAGGIVSAAVDGLRAAREIVRRFAPLR